MNKKKSSITSLIRDVKRLTRRKYSAEEKILEERIGIKEKTIRKRRKVNLTLMTYT